MASKTKLYAAVQPMVVLLLLSIGQPATAFRDPSVKHDLLKSTDAPSRIDLASELHHASINQPEFSTALRIIQNYESSPSCNRFAIHSLIKSCQSLEASSQEPPKGGSIEVVLEEVKSEFAARLAICELTGANAAIPPQCSRLIPSHAHCQSSGLGGFFRGTKTRKGGEHELCYPGLTAQQFDQCLRGLESRAQWWTSYSNARQNAVVVCQASRHAIEREEMLAMYRNMAEVTASQASALSASLDKTDGRLQEAEGFAAKVRQMQADYVKELERATGRTFSVLNQLSTGLKMLWDDIMHVSQTANEARSKLDVLTENLHHANDDLDQTRENIRTTHSDAIEKTTEIAAVAVRGHEANLERALSLHRELENAGLDIGSWTANLSLVNAELGRLYETSQRTHEQQEANLETQQRLGEQLRDMKESVETQKSAIEDATTKLQTLATARGFADLVRSWAGLAVMALVISMVSKELARLLVVVAGLMWAILNTFSSLCVYEGVHDCVRHVIAALSSFGQSPISLMIRLSAFLFVAVGFVLSARRYLHRSALIETEEGTLPMIEALQTTKSPDKEIRPYPATFSFSRWSV